ncbi:MAG: efflux RND transporter permease subunit [Cereibacter changlensis]
MEAAFGALGFSFGSSGQNSAMLFVKLKDFEWREGAAASALAMRANIRFMGHRAGQIIFMQPPSIQGLGNSLGFSMYLLDQAGNGYEALAEAADTLVANATGDGRVGELRGNDDAFESSLRLEIDQQK